MHLRYHVTPGIATLLCLFALPSSPASASAYGRVLSVYERTGAVSACDFSSRELASALKSVDPSQAQYFSDFTNAVDSALAVRASGGCKPADATAAGAAPSGVAGSSVSPGPVTAATSADLPGPIVLMAALGCLFVLVAVLRWIARERGWTSSPPWPEGWRHAWSEAGYRVGGTWAELLDWLHSRTRS